jgi:hypothetical protein
MCLSCMKSGARSFDAFDVEMRNAEAIIAKNPAEREAEKPAPVTPVDWEYTGPSYGDAD